MINHCQQSHYMTIMTRYSPEFIFIIKYIIMRRAGSSKYSSMALEIEVEFGRTDNFGVDDSSSRTIAGFVTIAGPLGKKSNVVTFTNNNHGNGWIDAELLTCPCNDKIHQ